MGSRITDDEGDELSPPLGDHVVPLFSVSVDEKWAKTHAEACAHEVFDLDDRWMKARCTKCHVLIEPYAILKQYANSWQDLWRQREEYLSWRKEEEKREIVKLARSEYCPPELRTRAWELVQWGMAQMRELKDLEAMLGELRKAVNAAIEARRDARRKKTGAIRMMPLHANHGCEDDSSGHSGNG